MREPLHYLLCKTGKAGCDVTCTHQYLTEDEVKKELGMFPYNPFASIAESLERIMKSQTVTVGTMLEQVEAGESESEKFFRHLNNGEVKLVQETDWTSWNGSKYETSGYRITITEGKE